jgi:hypothetical protein
MLPRDDVDDELEVAPLHLQTTQHRMISIDAALKKDWKQGKHQQPN